MKTKIPTMADYHKVLKEQGLGSIQKPFLVVPKVLIEKTKEFYGEGVDIYENKKINKGKI